MVFGIDKRSSLFNNSSHEFRAYTVIENQADSSG
jgi:hypothetical protein